MSKWKRVTYIIKLQTCLNNLIQMILRVATTCMPV